MLRIRSLLAASAVLVLVIALSACGGSSHKVGSAQEVLKETFGPDKPVKSGQLNLGLRFDSTGLQGLDGPIAATLSGPFQSKGGKTLPAFDFNLALNAAGADFSAGATSTGDTGFVKLQGTNYRLTSKFFSTFLKGYTQAATTDNKKASSSPSLATLGIDPRRWLVAPRKVGTEKVGGAETTHVTARVDVSKLLDDVDTLLRKAGTVGAAKAAGIPDGLSAKQRAQLTQAVKTTTFDVWSGVDDGTLRRLLVKVGFQVPAAAQKSAGGLKQGNLSIDLTIADLNKAQTIKAPTGAHPMSELTAQLGQLLGSATPSTSSGSGTAPATTPPTSSGAGSSPPSSEYLACLTAAGASISKVQACASLLSK